MKKFTLLLLPLALIACGEPTSETAKEPTAPSVETTTPATDSTMTDDEYKKQLDSLMDGVPYKLNADGVVTFDNVSDMITARNDYTGDGRFRSISNNPVHIEIYEVGNPKDIQENLDRSQRQAMLYGIYKTFTFTNIDKIKIDAGVKHMLEPNTVIVKPMTLTVTKEQALKALQAHTDAKDFKDLVADTNADFVIKGYSNSKMSEELYKDEIQKAIIKDLQK